MLFIAGTMYAQTIQINPDGTHTILIKKGKKQKKKKKATTPANNKQWVITNRNTQYE